MMDFIRDYLDLSIFAVLGLMSVLSLAYTVERMLHYRRLRVSDYDQLESLKLDLNKGLTTIATIASNAPYVGLLGTVFGIMLTFYDIGQSGQIDTQAVMVGLALALKATALGLVVAIPSMICYNALGARAEALQSEWKITHRRES
ncbi:MAG: TonB-system energizer ExbB [Granulosicoccaceae bacterium]